MKKLIYTGKFTRGDYNDMEAGYPVFIDSLSLSDLVKDILEKQNLPTNFCYEDHDIFKDKTPKNDLIGKTVTLTLCIKD